jgi:drug/metabolite transporter (DMT)-like permease
MMLAAGFTFALMNVLVKMLPHIHAVEIVFFRAIISLVITSFILIRSKISPWGSNRKILILRGVFGTAALVLFFYTLQVMPLASSLVIHYLSPIFTTLIALLFLREKLGKWQWVFFLISFLGILVVKGFDARIEWFDLLAGIGAALLSGAAYNCIRKLKFSEDSHVIIFYFPLIAMPITLLMSWLVFGWVQPHGWDWVILLGIGILTQVAQFLLTRAYQSESANQVAGVSNLGIIYGLGFGWLFFGELFDWKVLLGMMLVMFGVVANLLVPKKKA